MLDRLLRYTATTDQRSVSRTDGIGPFVQLVTVGDNDRARPIPPYDVCRTYWFLPLLAEHGAAPVLAAVHNVILILQYVGEEYATETC